MPKVYMVRHQKAGILTSHVFLAPPTDEQVAPLVAECERVHGRTGWVQIHEADLMTAEDVPSFPDRSAGAGKSNAAAQPFGVSGVGTVTPPAEK